MGLEWLVIKRKKASKKDQLSEDPGSDRDEVLFILRTWVDTNIYKEKKRLECITIDQLMNILEMGDALSP